MHGAFVVGLKEMIIHRFDENFWQEIVEEAGLELGFYPLSNRELEEKEAMNLVKAAAKKLNLGDRKFGEAFGNYWIKNFARQKYFAFFDAFKSSKDFINQLSEIHKKLTENLTQPQPPFFEINWENEHSVLINYQSDRALIHFAVGLLKALGDYYKEEISVYRVEKNQIKVFFK